MESTGNHIYRYRASVWHYTFYALMISMCLMTICVLTMLCWLYLTPSHHLAVPPSTGSSLFLITALILFIIDVIVGIFGIVVENLRSKRAHIVVDDTGLTLTDWRNKETHIDWDDIQEVWIKTKIGHINSSIDKIIVGPKRIWIRQGIENRQVLFDEIISRAHLTEKSGNWFQTRYSRPA